MIKDISENQLMQSFDLVVSFVKSFIEDDVALSIANNEVFLKFYDGEEVKLKMKDGDPIPKGSIAYQTITTGKTTTAIIPKEVFGIPTKAMGIPIIENGKVIGAISMAKSLKKQTEMQNLVGDLYNSLGQISTAANEISSQIQDIVVDNSLVSRNVEDTRRETEKTDEVLRFISNMAKQTNLLGLNASIESARAGEFGKGFGIVASEIRKLSASSNQSIEQISSILKNIQHSVIEIESKINKSTELVEHQAASIEEISSTIDNLYSTAQILKEIAATL